LTAILVLKKSILIRFIWDFGNFLLRQVWWV